jgi:hypothetical protein
LHRADYPVALARSRRAGVNKAHSAAAAKAHADNTSMVRADSAVPIAL